MVVVVVYVVYDSVLLGRKGDALRSVGLLMSARCSFILFFFSLFFSVRECVGFFRTFCETVRACIDGQFVFGGNVQHVYY